MGPVGFDLDMTLINSRPAILASFAEVARETATARAGAEALAGTWTWLDDACDPERRLPMD